MVLSCLAFAVMMALVRALTEAGLHPFEVAFFRNLIGTFFILPWMLRPGFPGLRTGHFRLHLLRALLGICAMTSLFTALSLMPLAEATALSFTAPLFATIGSALVLGERVRIRRWTATIVGFIGALIILRPGVAALAPGAGIALVAAMFIAAALLSVKALSRTEHPNTIVLIMGLLMTPMSLLPAVFVWQWPEPELWWTLVLMGLTATVGQVLMTRAFHTADASAVLPFDFSRLVFVAILGYGMFGEVPDIWTAIGSVVIIVAGVYIAQREATVGIPRSTPPPA
jgi:drug/metabolite transporter (DMT)-like permease